MTVFEAVIIIGMLVSIRRAVDPRRVLVDFYIVVCVAFACAIVEAVIREVMLR